jgi:hypothetical protein
MGRLTGAEAANSFTAESAKGAEILISSFWGTGEADALKDDFRFALVFSAFSAGSALNSSVFF